MGQLKLRQISQKTRFKRYQIIILSIVGNMAVICKTKTPFAPTFDVERKQIRKKAKRKDVYRDADYSEFFVMYICTSLDLKLNRYTKWCIPLILKPFVRTVPNEF